MSYWARVRAAFRPKSQEELDERRRNMPELEKGDLPAMLIAAVITFLPVLLIAMLVIYGSLWLFLGR